MNNRAVGTEQEQIAVNFLKQNNYHILTTNFRCKAGEIDIIAKEDRYLCFIEVKYRSGTTMGYPAEAINYRKIQRITRTAQFYMLLHQLSLETPCRFDAVVILDQDISLIKNAFDGV